MAMNINSIASMISDLEAAPASSEINRVLDALRAEMRALTAKKSGTHNIYNAVSKFIKAAEKIAPGRKALHAAWISPKSGKLCACDGFTAVRLVDTSVPVKRLDENETPFDIDSVIDPIALKSSEINRVVIPSKAFLKAYIKAWKLAYRKSDPLFSFGINRPVANANFLLQLLEIMPDMTLYAGESIYNPLYAIDPAGNDGVILPVRVNKPAKYNEMQAAVLKSIGLEYGTDSIK